RGRPQWRQAVGRAAVFQRAVRAADGPADAGDGGRRAGAMEGHAGAMAAWHAYPGVDRQRCAGADRWPVARRFRLAGADCICAGRLGAAGRRAR
nr:hypothetical protein [Tanacetum cinerariifolium]